MKNFMLILAAWVLVCVPAVLGNPILDVVDWEIPDELQAVLMPDVQEYIPIEELREQMVAEVAEQKTASVPDGGVSGIPGAWDAALWREHDFRNEEVVLPLDRNITRFLDRLTLSDWIGISEYRDVRNPQIYRIDESMLTVPEPGEVILPMVILGTVVLIVWQAL